MNNRLSDLRCTLTQDDADRMLEEYARLYAHKVSIEAGIERRIVELKARAQPKLDCLGEAMSALAASIEQYVSSHSQAFKKPRTRKTSYGEYGLRTVTSLDAKTDKTIFAALKDVGLIDCIQTTESLVKPTIINRINLSPDLAAWFRVHGITIKTGDTVVLKVSKSLIDAARKAEGIAP